MKKTLIVIFLIILLGFFYLKEREFKIETIESIGKSENYYFIFPSITELHKDDVFEFNVDKVDNLREKKKFDKKLRSKVIELLKMPDYVVLEPRADIVKDEDKGKYIERKIRIYTSFNTLSHAYLLIPKEKNNKIVIAMHQHGGNYEYGKEEVVGNLGDENMFFGKELAERGYFVFAMDAPLFGENNLFFENSTGVKRNSAEIEEQFATQSLLLYGYTPLGAILQQDMTALNFLLSLEGFDKENIGCIGHSFGGARCMYLAAMDERIKAVVLSNSVANFRRDYDKSILHTWLTLLPGIAKYTEINGVLGLIAPRPLMIVYSENDPINPENEVKEQILSMENLYEKLGRKEEFKSLYLKGKAHEFPLEYHEQAYEFFDKNLKN